MEVRIQMDFSPFYSWMTSRHWGLLLGFNLEEQEERNNVQSKRKCISPKGAGKQRSKLSSNLLPRTVTLDKCPLMFRPGRRAVASRTAPNSEVDALPGPGCSRARPAHSESEARMGAPLRRSSGRNRGRGSELVRFRASCFCE